MLLTALKWPRRRADSDGSAEGGGRAAFAARLAHERVKVAKLKAKVAAAQEGLAALEAEHARLREDHQQLRKLLRWHWAAYPGAKSDWLERKDKGDPFAERALMLKSRLVELMASPEFAPDDRRVTAVVTSCGRHDLLERTLRTFFELNTHAETRMIVVEDGDKDPPQALKEAFSRRPIQWINTGGRVGQIQAIDLAYSRVRTPYVFHMEDDWIFVRPAFIEKSLAILQAEPLCLQVWIKGRPGRRGHGAYEIDRASGEVSWRPVIKDRKNVWHGFSFNPGLRRIRAYRLLGSFGEVAERARGKAATAEAQLSEIYASVGFFAALIWEDDGAAFVEHIGVDRHVA